MKDWVVKLDDFVCLSEREILNHAGTISHKQAIDKAHAEYDKYHTLTVDESSPVEQHFIKVVQAMKQLEIQNKN